MEALLALTHGSLNDILIARLVFEVLIIMRSLLFPSSLLELLRDLRGEKLFL
jgi:hypothetical protein